MACQNNNCNNQGPCPTRREGSSAFIILIVLYILLAIILGSRIW